MRPCVLVVDDTQANLVALEAQLSRLDCEVVRASSGNEALRWLLKRRFAVMLLDVQMPGMDGYEVAKLARENPSTHEVPIIFVTAMDQTELSALEGYEAGAVDYLFKPINPIILRSKVRVFLELHVGRERLAREIDAHRVTMNELEAFNYSVSHDLRAPLRPIRGFSEAVLEDQGEKLGEQGRAYLQRIIAAADRMSALIEDLLGMSQVVRAEMQVSTIDLAEIARAVVAELRASTPAHAVSFECPERLPGRGDARLLRIVLENLLRNAWKFSAKQQAPQVAMGMHEDAGVQVYFIRDNGAGFDSAYASKLFQPFQRLHAAAEFEGTGIGLAIVQRVIHRHGGEVWAKGAPDEGATFSFTLFQHRSRAET